MNSKQRIYRLFCAIIVCLAAVFGLNPSAYADRWYVDGSVADCDNNGDSWMNALKYLQDALTEAANTPGSDEIWVRAGTYYPDQDCANPDGTGLRQSTFLLDFNNIQLLGGFDGTETLPEQREPADNITVLSGDITFPLEDFCGPGNGRCFVPNNTPGCEDAACCDLVCQMDPFCCIDPWIQNCANIANDNCTGGELPYGAYHVVTALNVDETVRIDGFTITLGSAGGGGPNGRRRVH